MEKSETTNCVSDQHGLPLSTMSRQIVIIKISSISK